MASKRKTGKAKTARKAMGKIYYVYGLVDPRDGKLFYVGKGKGDRIQYHVKEWDCGGHSNSNLKKLRRIDEIYSSGHEVEHRYIRCNLTERQAFKLEGSIIRALKASLTNTDPGRASEAERYCFKLASILNRKMTPEEFKQDPNNGWLGWMCSWKQEVQMYRHVYVALLKLYLDAMIKRNKERATSVATAYASA